MIKLYEFQDEFEELMDEARHKLSPELFEKFMAYAVRLLSDYKENKNV